MPCTSCWNSSTDFCSSFQAGSACCSRTRLAKSSMPLPSTRSVRLGPIEHAPSRQIAKRDGNPTGASQNWTTDLSAYFTGSVLKVTALSTMLFTVVIFAISAVCLLVAAVIYVPLLCTIQGNLKEYCCHKVDKRCVACLSHWLHLLFCCRS